MLAACAAESGRSAVGGEEVAASVLDTLNKKPIELRDKKVATIDPGQVSAIAITTDLAATTQPTTRPASHKETIIEHGPNTTTKSRRHETQYRRFVLPCFRAFVAV